MTHLTTKIENILPKLVQRPKSDCPYAKYHSYDTCADCARIDAYNQVLAEVRAKIPEIIDCVYADLSAEILPKIEKFIAKVESGGARSKETYADMLAIRSMLSINQK